MKKLFKYIIPIIVVTFLGMSMWSCSGDDGPNGDTPPREDIPTVDRTVLVYIVGTNNLGGALLDYDDIDEMIAGSRKGALDHTNTRWLVYHCGYYNTSRLFEIAKGDTTTLKHYGNDVSSVSVSRMSEVLDDIARLAPASDYGLVLWSHGSGWLENGLDEDADKTNTLSFGDDRGAKMNVTSLAKVLEGRDIDYVYFDACHMCTVEVAYELRHATRYIVGGPAETPGAGMPYDLTMASLAAGSIDNLVEAAGQTFDHYRLSSDCAMTVLDLSEIEALADATAQIYDATPLPHPSAEVTNYYGRARSGNFIDFGEYVGALADSNALDRTAFDRALQKTVVYSAAPDRFYSWALLAWLPIYNASGLSTYVFNSPDDFGFEGYDNLQWAKNVAARHLHN